MHSALGTFIFNINECAIFYTHFYCINYYSVIYYNYKNNKKVMPNTTPEETQDQEVSESPILGAFSGILSSVLDIAQQNIVERIQTVVEDILEQAQVTATDVIDQTKAAINEVVQNAVVLFIIVLLGFVGFIFTIVGLSLWLGEVSGLGTWFGFLIVGIIIFIVSLIAALVQKNKQ